MVVSGSQIDHSLVHICVFVVDFNPLDIIRSRRQRGLCCVGWFFVTGLSPVHWAQEPTKRVSNALDLLYLTAVTDLTTAEDDAIRGTCLKNTASKMFSKPFFSEKNQTKTERHIQKT